jgi:hypothetical protein
VYYEMWNKQQIKCDRIEKGRCVASPFRGRNRAGSRLGRFFAFHTTGKRAKSGKYGELGDVLN